MIKGREQKHIKEREGCSRAGGLLMEKRKKKEEGRKRWLRVGKQDKKRKVDGKRRYKGREGEVGSVFR